jgi:thiamine-phosphate pyrophosphorylase
LTPRLVAISDRRVASAEVTLERFFELGRLAQPGSVIFQLRDLELSVRERMRFGLNMARLAREVGQRFLVNDRVDLAVLLGADGVHLGERSIDTRDARSLVGGALISRACHEPVVVGRLAADAVLLSPLAEARKGRQALGLDGLRRARESIAQHQGRALLFALGGISARVAAECRAAGADGVAVVGAVLRGEGAELVRALGIERGT